MARVQIDRVVLIFVAGLLASSSAHLLTHVIPLQHARGVLAAISMIGDSLTLVGLLAAVYLYLRVQRTP